MSRKPDPRPGRTRALLFDALLELIQEKRWDRIRVQDVLDRTGIGRSTFYAHYDNKFDLLTANIPQFAMPLAVSGEPDLLPLFEHVEEMQPVMRPIMSQPLLAEILDSFHKQLVLSWLAYLQLNGVSEKESEWMAEFLSGALLAVARSWLNAGCSPSASTMSDQFTRYANAVVTS